MKSILSATHLLRRFVLFALTVLLLLSVLRAAYGLWQFPKIAETQAFVALFVQGLRFDLSLIGLLCIVPVVVGSLLSITKLTRGLARFIIILFLMMGLFLVLGLEFLTPWFISIQGVRPDHHLVGAVEDPLKAIITVFDIHTVPVVIGAVVSALILIAFWMRLEANRFLRHRISAPTGILLAVVGGFVCLVAIWSNPDLRKTPFSPVDSLISADVTVNEMAMNTSYKALYSLASQFFISTATEE